MTQKILASILIVLLGVLAFIVVTRGVLRSRAHFEAVREPRPPPPLPSRPPIEQTPPPAERLARRHVLDTALPAEVPPAPDFPEPDRPPASSVPSHDRALFGDVDAGRDEDAIPLHAPFKTDSAVVVSEIYYHPSGSDEEERLEFVELVNRSERSVDLAGWRLADAVRFEFPVGSDAKLRLAPRERIVVARDPGALARATGLDPGRIRGPFEGRLGNRAETLVLLDADDHESDWVPWRDDGLWPARADGLGSSLERVSLDAPGVWPQNWSVATDALTPDRELELLGHGGPVRWFESARGTDPWERNGHAWYEPAFDDRKAGFRDGRLAVGYDLASSRSGWIFTRATARAGLHSIWLRLPFKVPPQAPGKRPLVPELLIDADDGWIAWLDGREIARGGVALSPGELPRADGTYWGTVVNAHGDGAASPAFERVWRGAPGSISPGDHLLAMASGNANATSSDLFLSARLVLVETSRLTGATPGEPGPLEGTGLAPLVHSIEREPREPAPTDPVKIRCRIAGPDPEEVILEWNTGKESKSVAMQREGDAKRDSVSLAKPADVARSLSSSPERGPVYVATVPAAPAWTVVRYAITARAKDGSSMRYPRIGDPASELAYYVAGEPTAKFRSMESCHILWHGEPSCAPDGWVDDVVFVAGGTAWTAARLKNRGDTSCWRPKRGLRVAFPKGHRFLGQDRLNFLAGWEDRSLLREVIGWELFRDLGHPYCEARLTAVYRDHGVFWGVFVALESPSEDFLERNGIDRDAALWKCRNAFRDGWPHELEPLSDITEEDEGALARFATDVIAFDGPKLIEWVESHVDVESLLDYQTAKSLISDEDGFEKNWLLCREVEKRADGSTEERWHPLAWDLDLSFGQTHLSTDFHHYDKHPLMGTRDHPRDGGNWNGLLDAVLGGRAEDYFVRALYGRLWRALEEKFHPDLLLARIDELDLATIDAARADLARWPRWGQAPEDPAFHRDRLREYVRRRWAFLREFLTAENPTTYLDPRQLPRRRSGRSVPNSNPRPNPFRTFRYVPAPRMKISEISIDRGGMGELEFVEIVNLEDREVDISGWDLPVIEYRFPPASRAPPHGIVVVARNPEAIGALVRGQSSVQVFGPFRGSLDAKGETLRLRDSGVDSRGKRSWPETIDVVRYGAYGPWPQPEKGSGRSIELVSISLDNDYAESWRESESRGGTPGRVSD